MASKMRHGLLISFFVISLIVISFNTSYSDTTNYIYDELNRLKRVEYGDGAVIEYIYDQAGNRTEIRTPSSDTTPPTTTATPAGGAYNTAQTVTLTCDDGNGVGCDNNEIYYSTDGNDPTTIYTSPINISVTTTLKFFAKDLASNSESVKTQVYTIETTPPTGTISINAGAASTNSINVTLTLSCSDANDCSQMRFSNDNVTYSGAESYGTSKTYILTTGNGTKTVWAKFKDKDGNWSKTTTSASILLDTIAPTTTASPPGGTYTGSVDVTLSCADGAGSGCDKIYYTTNGAFPNTSSPEYLSPIHISVNTTLRFFAKDFAGNSEAVKTQNYTITP